MRFTADCVVATGQPGQDRIAQIIDRRQRLGLDQGVVEADHDRRIVGALLRRVAVFEVQRHTVFAPAEQVWRQVQRHSDVTRIVTGHIQFVGRHQLAKLDQPITWQPVRRVVRLTRREHVDPFDQRTAADQALPADHQRVDRFFQLGGITPGDHQQLAVWVVGVRHHRQGRALWRRHGQSAQLQRTLALEQYQRIALGRQFVEVRREAGHARAGLGRTDPRRQRTGGFQRGVVGCRAHHHRQVYITVIAAVEERQRQNGQIVGQRERRHADVQTRVVVDPRPQAGMLGVFAAHCVVADELQVQAVELGDHLRRNLDQLNLRLASALFGQWQGRCDFVVDHDVDLRQLGQQCR
ncbi:hypothetical protein ALP75_203318 [Pseudomonas syringae pv. actinidiae]|nr:hypothetical protein ALP75_203318 [Pseudomonas syringae pv. actinidiae]